MSAACIYRQYPSDVVCYVFVYPSCTHLGSGERHHRVVVRGSLVDYHPVGRSLLARVEDGRGRILLSARCDTVRGTPFVFGGGGGGRRSSDRVACLSAVVILAKGTAVFTGCTENGNYSYPRRSGGGLCVCCCACPQVGLQQDEVYC